MKKITTLFLSLVCAFSFGQTSLSTAVDFTVTDIHGNTHNLFNILNGGQHVILDFFFTTCPSCIASAPDYTQAYNDYGCNQGDVYFLSIDNGDDDTQVLAYELSYMGLNPPPAASGIQGGGNSVVSTYGIGAYPTFLIIAPNKQIVNQDIWPFSYSILESELTSYGINKMPCTTSLNPINDINISIFPNPASDFISIELNGNAIVSIFNMLGENILSTNVFENKIINTSDLFQGFYVVEINLNNKIFREKILIK